MQVFVKLVLVLLLFVLDKQLERVQELAHKKIGRERKQTLPSKNKLWTWRIGQGVIVTTAFFCFVWCTIDRRDK